MLVSLRPLSNILITDYFSQEPRFKGALSILRDFWLLKSFKNDEKCFLFHLKLSFHSQDI